MGLVANIDRSITAYVMSWPKSWQPIFKLCSFIGEPAVVLSVSFFVYLLALNNDSQAIKKALFIGGIAYGISIIIKLLVRRQRPGNFQIKTLGIKSYSFPSGHAVGTVIFYGLFAWLAYQHLPMPLNLAVFCLSWLVILVVGLSRIRLKFHYPSDVIIGWLIGFSSLAVMISVCF